MSEEAKHTLAISGSIEKVFCSFSILSLDLDLEGVFPVLKSRPNRVL